MIGHNNEADQLCFTVPFQRLQLIEKGKTIAFGAKDLPTPINVSGDVVERTR